jgi:hypothetical protein
MVTEEQKAEALKRLKDRIAKARAERALKDEAVKVE